MTATTLTHPISTSGAVSAPLTLDEARLSVIRTALVCLQRARCGPHSLLTMVRGGPGGDDCSSDDERLALHHRRVLHAVIAAGHGWVVDEQLDAIISATGLDEGDVHNIDAIAAQLPDPDRDALGAID